MGVFWATLCILVVARCSGKEAVRESFSRLGKGTGVARQNWARRVRVESWRRKG